MYKLLIFGAATLIAGCFTTRDIPAVQFQKLKSGLRNGELILRTDKGKPVRFGPRSQIRFHTQNNRLTSWYRGHQLRVNRAGVCTKKGCTPPKDGWTWDQIKSAQVKNLSGGKTYAAVFVTVAVVAVTVAVVAALASGKGGGGKLNLKGIFPRGVRVRGLRPRGGGGVRVRGLRPRGGSGVRVRGLRPRGGGGSVRVNRPHHHGRRPGRVHPPGNRNILDGLPQPDPGPGPDDQKTHSATDAERSAPPPPPPPPPPPGTSNQPPVLSLHAAPGKTSSIFGHHTRRRSSIRLIGLVEGGGDLLLADGGNIQALVGMRILDVLELAAGAHLMIHRGEDQTQDHRASWIGVFRLNLHFDVDARRRFALPLGFDLGAGQATFYARLNFGLRIRVTQRLSLGIYPFNPTYAQFKDTTLKRKPGWWSFPTTIDLSFAL